MILNGQTAGTPSFMVNLHYTDDVEQAKKIVDYVVYSPIGMLVSSAFGLMNGDIAYGHMTRRGGFQFNFWFLTEIEARLFAEHWKELVWYWDDDNKDLIRQMPYDLVEARRGYAARMRKS